MIRPSTQLTPVIMPHSYPYTRTYEAGAVLAYYNRSRVPGPGEKK